MWYLCLESAFLCEDKLLSCHFWILNSLCQENQISIKKIFFNAYRRCFCAKYTLLCEVLWCAGTPLISISFILVFCQGSFTLHTSVGTGKNEWNWTLKLNSHLTSPVSPLVWLWCLQGSYTSFILIRVTPSIAVPSAQRDGIFLSQIKDQISLFKLVAGHVMITFPRKDSLWHQYTTKCNAEFLCPLQCVLTSAWHC